MAGVPAWISDMALALGALVFAFGVTLATSAAVLRWVSMHPRAVHRLPQPLLIPTDSDLDVSEQETDFSVEWQMSEREVDGRPDRRAKVPASTSA